MLPPSLIFVALSAFIGNSFSSTSGSNRISTHYYHKDAHLLDASPVMCGILGSHMDLTRVTAVQDLTSSECGTCLKVTGNNKSVYVMAVDKGGMGLDINMDSFKELFGEDTGRFDASWEATDSGKCAGIIKGGSYELPGYRSTPGSNLKPDEEPKKGTSTSSYINNNKDQPTQISESKTSENVKESSQINSNSNKQSDFNSSTKTMEKEYKSTLTNNEQPKSTQIPSDNKCNEFEIKCEGTNILTQCILGISIQFTCPKNTKCVDVNGTPVCQ